MKYKDIYQVSFLKQFGWVQDKIEEMVLPTNSYCINIDDILKYCGLHTEESTEPHIQGGINGHVIYINPENNEEEIRFRKAHGLGHYVLGHIGDAGQYREETERAADEFAEYLLAPEVLAKAFVTNYVKKNGFDSIKNDVSPLVSAAGRAMQVPEQIVRNRMKDIGIITEKK